MNINPIIEKIFADFEIGGRQIPIAYSQYFGNEDTYLTYYTWAERPHLFADDNNKIECCYATVDIWSKGNFKEIVEAVKQKLKENNCSWTDNGPETYEPDTGYFHVPVNFHISSVDGH